MSNPEQTQHDTTGMTLPALIMLLEIACGDDLQKWPAREHGELIHVLSQYDLITADTDMPRVAGNVTWYDLTRRGAAFVSLLVATPIPITKFVDPRCGSIIEPMTMTQSSETT